MNYSLKQVLVTINDIIYYVLVCGLDPWRGYITLYSIRITNSLRSHYLVIDVLFAEEDCRGFWSE